MRFYNHIFFNLFQIEDIKAIHANNSHHENEGLLSLDGVHESKSTNVSLDVYTVKFKGCRDVFPIKIVWPLNKYPINNNEQFSEVINSVMALNLIIQAIIADNPKRAFMKNSLQHSSKHACEYCFQCGVSFTLTNEEEIKSFLEKIKKTKKRNYARNGPSC